MHISQLIWIFDSKPRIFYIWDINARTINVNIYLKTPHFFASNCQHHNSFSPCWIFESPSLSSCWIFEHIADRSKGFEIESGLGPHHSVICSRFCRRAPGPYGGFKPIHSSSSGVLREDGVDNHKARKYKPWMNSDAKAVELVKSERSFRTTATRHQSGRQRCKKRYLLPNRNADSTPDWDWIYDWILWSGSDFDLRTFQSSICYMNNW